MHLPSLFLQFPPLLFQASRFGSTERRKAIATVWLPSSPSPGRNHRTRGLTPLGPRSPGLRLPVRRGRAGVRPLRDPGRGPASPAPAPSPRPAAERRHPTVGGAGLGACARRSRACRPHSPHPLRELVTSCPRPISVRGQSVAPCRSRRVSASPFLRAPRRQLRLFVEGQTEKERD